MARTLQTDVLARELLAAGLTSTSARDGAVHTEAAPDVVGEIAFRAGVVLTELRSAESTGLEEIFLELTADDQREEAVA